jgi:hypothetical protein
VLLKRWEIRKYNEKWAMCVFKQSDLKPILLFIGAVVRTPACSQHYDHIPILWDGENAANLAVIEALRMPGQNAIPAQQRGLALFLSQSLLKVKLDRWCS